MSLSGPGLAVAGVVLALVGVALGVLLARRVRPFAIPATEDEIMAARTQVAALTEQATRLAQGDALSAPPTEPAMAALHHAAQRMQSVIEARAHIVATERDLDQARRMYRQILPLQSAAEHGKLSLAGFCSPAAETGGDWWTYRKLSGGRILLVIGDATGHGVHSAMIGCMAHGAVRALTQLGEEFLAPRRVLDAVHSAIKVPGVEHAAMTLFSALIDPRAGTVEYFNHGHVFPLIARRDASGTIVEVTSITGERDLTEGIEDSIDLEMRSGVARILPGSVLVCFTDGLIERQRQARQFGARRLQQALMGAVVPPSVDGLTALRDKILKTVDEYAGGTPLEDDITLVLCGVAS